MLGRSPRTVVGAADYGEIGPGWALLAVRLERRLRRGGAPPDMWPRLLTTGAGEMTFALPVRAPHWVHRVARAMSRLALRRCELCLRGPVVQLSINATGVPETLRLCAWHRDRLAVLRLPSGIRVEAWDIVQFGAGALRAMLLGGRLSPSGVEAALAQVAESIPVAAPVEDAWIPPDLVVHALARLAPATLAGVSVDALLPLLSDPDAEVRQAAVLALARVRGDGPDEAWGEATTPAAQRPATEPPALDDATHLAVGPQATPEPLPRPAYPLRGAWLVVTTSGSEYLVVRDANRAWWLGGRNARSARSAPLPPGRLYPIERPVPWPPELGSPLVLTPCHRLHWGNPARLPGGGKRTSAVESVTDVTPEQALAGSPPSDDAPPTSGATETSTVHEHAAPAAEERA